LPKLDENGGSARELEEPECPVLAQHGDSKRERQRHDQYPSCPTPPPFSGRRGEELERISPRPGDGLRKGSDVHVLGIVYPAPQSRSSFNLGT
jgi:hypothetical protein